jgi:hypothetical protein
MNKGASSCAFCRRGGRNWRLILKIRRLRISFLEAGFSRHKITMIKPNKPSKQFSYNFLSRCGTNVYFWAQKITWYLQPCAGINNSTVLYIFWVLSKRYIATMENNNAYKIQFKNYGLLVSELYSLIATKFLQVCLTHHTTLHTRIKHYFRQHSNIIKFYSQ